MQYTTDVGFMAEWPNRSFSSVKDSWKRQKDTRTVRNKIIWSEETEIELFMPNSLPNTIPTVKHYSGMVGVFFWWVEEQLNRAKYGDILKENLAR